jgi:hypothetical protein
MKNEKTMTNSKRRENNPEFYKELKGLLKDPDSEEAQAFIQKIEDIFYRLDNTGASLRAEVLEAKDEAIWAKDKAEEAKDDMADAQAELEEFKTKHEFRLSFDNLYDRDRAEICARIYHNVPQLGDLQVLEEGLQLEKRDYKKDVDLSQY